MLYGWGDGRLDSSVAFGPCSTLRLSEPGRSGSSACGANLPWLRGGHAGPGAFGLAVGARARHRPARQFHNARLARGRRFARRPEASDPPLHELREAEAVTAAAVRVRSRAAHVLRGGE
jgi:hypothetical protein